MLSDILASTTPSNIKNISKILSGIACITSLIFILIIVLSLEKVKCTIDGTITTPRQDDTNTRDDPCKPLYWYPKNIPEYCNYRTMPTPPPDTGPDQPIPIPIPVPVPPPLPIPMPLIPPPVVPPIMMPPHVPPPGQPPPIAVPHPIMPLPMPLPFGIPLMPTNPMVPVAGIPLPPPPPPPMYPLGYPSQYPMPYPPYPPYPSPYPSPFPQPMPAPFPGPYPAPYPPYPSYPPFPMPPRKGMGMVPGIPGIVSPDGGINIMPFSDAYSDILEKHKQKMITKRLQKMLSDYEKSPWKSRRKTRRHNGKEVIYEDSLVGNAIDN